MNTIGSIFRFTDFGESHGVAVGGVLDGCPSEMVLDMDAIRYDLDRRAGRVGEFSAFISPRAKEEEDEIEWLSGLHEGATLGSPIAFIVRNKQARAADYASLKEGYRPGHADYTYACKYGVPPMSGGGRASARETVARVVAGAIAKQVLKKMGVTVESKIVQIGSETEKEGMIRLLEEVRAAGDSIGAIVHTSVKGVPPVVGEPIFDKLQARLAAAVMSINACKGFAYGSGFKDVALRGSELNDAMPYRTNHAGGILGGISNGQEIYFDAVFKPTPSIRIKQQTVDALGGVVDIAVTGRHDVCVGIRAVPVVEAMTALTMVDMCLAANIFEKK